MPHVRSASAVLLFVLTSALPAQEPPRLRWLDLDGDTARQATVHRDFRQYLGHPTTVQLPDGAVLCVHPRGHGKGAIVLQRSDDGGRTWSAPLPTPENWATSLETPTIHRLVDKAGTARLVVFSGLHPIRRSVSTDDGQSWTPLEPIGEFGGIVAMSSLVPLADGTHAAWFHDDGRFFRANGTRAQFTVYQTISGDGGLTWSQPTAIWTGAELDLCEPGVVRSPDGKRLAMLLRENTRKATSHVMFSDDEAATWSSPVPLPAALTGDRHVGAYAPDGRLVVSFRDMAEGSPTRGDWVLWVGTFADVERGRDGQYRVRLSRNYRGTDCGYPAIETFADGTLLLTSYGHFEPGEQPFVRAIRLRTDELDALARGPEPDLTRAPGTVRPTQRGFDWWPTRVEQELAAARQGGHRLVMLGDSITEGWGTVGKECWQEFWAPRKAINVGISGDKTQSVLWRLDHGLLEALAGNGNDVRAVVVMIGTNNSNGDEATAEQIGDGIVAVVERLRRGLPKAKVLLLSIFPRGELPGPQREKNNAASARAQAAFANDAFVVCRDIGGVFLDAEGRITKDVMPDRLHLSKQAYRRWAEAIVADVDAMLR
jgi:lysophospholipase L1-like esterase